MYCKCKNCGKFGNHAKVICESCIYDKMVKKYHEEREIRMKMDMERKELERKMQLDGEPFLSKL